MHIKGSMQWDSLQVEPGHPYPLTQPAWSLLLSSPVQWRRAGATALPEGSAIQQGSLVLPSASLALMGTYSCHDEDGGLLHTVALRLGRE